MESVPERPCPCLAGGIVITLARYPKSFDEIDSWALATGRARQDARARFAQYSVLRAIGSVPLLIDSLVFKGGNALDFVWLPNRSTTDLDFSLDSYSGITISEAALIENMLVQGCNSVGPQLNTTLKLHQFRQNPPGPDRQFFTYHIKIGYVLKDQTTLIRNISRGASNPQTVELDISVNEAICEDHMTRIDSRLSLRVATPADIVAEKLRAILQQASRNRQRAQDVLDIAGILESDIELNPESVSRFLLKKAAARSVTVSKSAFRNAETVVRSSTDYAALERTTSVRFIPFDEAYELLLAFVQRLDIPE